VSSLHDNRNGDKASRLGKKVNVTKHRSEAGRVIGDRVKALRKLTGLLQEQVAERGGIRREEVSNAELGRNLVSTDRMLRGLAKGLGVSSDALRSYLDGELPLVAVHSGAGSSLAGQGASTTGDAVIVSALHEAKKKAATKLVRNYGVDDVDYARELVEATIALEQRLGHEPVPPDPDAIAATAMDIARARGRLRRAATEEELAALGLDRPSGPKPSGPPPPLPPTGVLRSGRASTRK
jgi:transcriptional regulator with XRE-family HTH domain